jgi:phosphatidylserine/phosphatidylglycerophosphate/cardiolipin synthase-like enzyme
MKFLLFYVLVCAVAWNQPYAHARGCQGGACRVCTNCTACRHCAKEGGSCSVCTGGKAAASTRSTARSTTRSTGRLTTRSAAPAIKARPANAAPTRYVPPSLLTSAQRQALLEAKLTTPAASATSGPVPPGAGSAKVEVYFSPGGGAQAAIIKEIDAAREWIRIQAYSYTSAPISEALLRAIKRGVKVKAVLDKSNQTAQYTGATFLQNAGATVLTDSKHAIAHNKVMVIDGAVVITGSFNFSKAAEESNAENLVILKDCPQIVGAYSRNFRTHEAHSTLYARK